MKPIHRTLAGLALAAILLPILIGTLACLPVPIGNPEKSRVDPELSGVWFDVFEETLWVIQPYDRRTYLVTLYDFWAGDCVAPPYEEPGDAEESDAGDVTPEELEAEASTAAAAEANGNDALEEELIEEIIPTNRYRPETYDGDVDADAALAWYKNFIIALRQDCDAEAVISEVYKSWLTRLGKREFLTMELTGVFDEGFDDRASFSPEYWSVWRISRLSSAATQLELVDPDFEAFEEVEETPEDYEKVIRAHANDPELTDVRSLLLLRVPPHDLGYLGGSIEPPPGDLLFNY